MKYVLLNYNELTEGREVLNNETPSFILIFICLIVFLVSGIFLWMWFGEAEDFVIAQGHVLPFKDASVIRNTVSGYVKQTFYRDGQHVEAGELLYTIENKTEDVQKNNLQAMIGKVNAEINELTKLERSVIENKNGLAESSDFYYRFQAYHSTYQQLYDKCQLAKTDYFNNIDLYPSGISQEQLEKLKVVFHNSQTDLEGLKSQTLAAIKDELRDDRKQLLNLQSSTVEAEQRIALSRIIAPITGTVQIQQVVNPGEFIPSDMVMVKIIPTEETNYRMELSVKNRNVGLLKIGQLVKYNFEALPFQEYGFGNGKIVYITKDTTEDQQMIYRVQGTIVESQLANISKEIGKIKPGMLCQARIIVRKKKIIFLVMEKIGLFFGKFGT